MAIHDQLVAAGAELVVCVSVNDPFVMAAWEADQKVDGKVTLLADTCGDFSAAMGMVLEGGVEKMLGNKRSKRYMMIIDNGKIGKIVVDEKGIELTSAEAALAELKTLSAAL